MAIVILLLFYFFVFCLQFTGGMSIPSKLAPLRSSISAGNLPLVQPTSELRDRADAHSNILWSFEAREKSRVLSYRAPTVYVIDAVAGLTAALVVAPFLATIDKGTHSYTIA